MLLGAVGALIEKNSDTMSKLNGKLFHWIWMPKRRLLRYWSGLYVSPDNYLIETKPPEMSLVYISLCFKTVSVLVLVTGLCVTLPKGSCNAVHFCFTSMRSSPASESWGPLLTLMPRMEISLPRSLQRVNILCELGSASHPFPLFSMTWIPQGFMTLPETHC